MVHGRLPLGRLVTGHIALADIDDALESMRRRDGARRVITFEEEHRGFTSTIPTRSAIHCAPAMVDERLRGVSGIALALRFLLELGGVAALAWWGLRTGTDDVSRAVLSIGAAGLLIVLWALVVAPKARNPLAPRVRWLIGSGLLLVAAGALWRVDATAAAVVFAILVVVDTLVLLALDRRPTAGSGTNGGTLR